MKKSQNPENNIYQNINSYNEFSVWGSLDIQVSQPRLSNTSSSSAILEIQNYLDDALLPRDKDPL